MLWATVLTAAVLHAAESPPVAAARSLSDSDSQVDGCGAPAVRAIGRHDRTAEGHLRFGYSGAGVAARFVGTRVSVVLKETVHAEGMHGRYLVRIDGHDVGTLRAEPGITNYDIASGLSPVVHTVELLRRTEGFASTGEFVAFDFGDGGELLAPPCERDRRILFIGDSVTAGFGALGKGPDCDFRPEYEDFFVGFAALTAKKLKADAQVVAWSGHGILRNDSGNDVNTLPKLFERALPKEAASVWDHERFSPDVIVILAGANDLVRGIPDEAQFIETYARFIRRLQTLHPSARVVLGISPMLNDVWPRKRHARSTSRRFTERVAVETDSSVIEFDEQSPENGFGCTWHPSPKTHARMSSKLVKLLRRELKW